MDIVDFYLIDLKTKYLKVNPEEYYLSNSGGKDSYLLYWFLKVWLKENDNSMYEAYKNIPIIGINTYMEHPEIRKRIYDNSDRVLKPEMKPFDIKSKYGIPCFSKQQDDWIHRFQNGSRRPYLIERITGINKDTGEPVQGRFKCNNTAKELVLNGNLHKVSPMCCKKLKKKAAHKYEKESGRKPILCITGDEGILRKAQYKSCFTKKGTFTPLWDLSEDLENQIYRKYNIELPNVYKYVKRTGCMGCPYGSYYGDTEKELLLVSENQYKFLWNCFGESYNILGIKHLTEEERQVEKERMYSGDM